MKEQLIESDVVDIIIFSDNYIRHSYGYMQFKDILNRTHYKRISKAKSTRLARDLGQKDAEIYLVDGDKLSPPNPALNIPGIIEINGERIEYFSKTGNILGQLRRGTLGTGVPELHRFRSNVLDIGTTETIPYQDKTIVNSVYGALTSVDLDYVPVNSNELEVFVGGLRLKKSAYSLFEVTNGYPYSPEGDTEYPEEFTVDGTSNSVTLTNPVDENIKVTVVKKIGKIWHPEDSDITYTDNAITNFIKNTEAIFSQYLVDKYQYVLADDTGVTLTTDDNEPLELD